MLTRPPDQPKLKRSPGSGLPKNRRHAVHAIVRLYDEVNETTTRETIALKPTVGPKFMQTMQEDRATLAQTARRGVSASGTWSIGQYCTQSVEACMHVLAPEDGRLVDPRPLRNSKVDGLP